MLHEFPMTVSIFPHHLNWLILWQDISGAGVYDERRTESVKIMEDLVGLQSMTTVAPTVVDAVLIGMIWKGCWINVQNLPLHQRCNSFEWFNSCKQIIRRMTYIITDCLHECSHQKNNCFWLVDLSIATILTRYQCAQWNPWIHGLTMGLPWVAWYICWPMGWSSWTQLVPSTARWKATN